MNKTPTPGTRLQTIAFPVEHGGWGFLAEPVLLGLFVAPTWSGMAIGVASVAAFLFRHPAKLYWRNRHRFDMSPRFRIARRFAVLYASVAVAGLVVAIRMAGWGPLLPFLILAPALAVYAAYDASNQGRRLLPELAAAMGLAASAPAIAVAGGWLWPAAGALWLLLQLRAVPSILYVRARLRLERGEEIDRRLPSSTHALAVAIGILLWRGELGPLLAAAGLLVLLGRAVRGLSATRRPAKARQVGLSELAFGLGYVVACAIGFGLEV